MRATLVAAGMVALASVSPLRGVGPEQNSRVNGAALLHAASAATAPAGAKGEVSGARSMRAVMTRRYTMAGKVRPLLFWIGKEDIGLARIVWRRGESGAVGYELLVGTDPAKAPRSLNRWGYVAEDVEGADGSLLALMTGAEEANYNEAASNASRAPGAGDFKAIHARVLRGAATWQTARVSTPSALTVHDVDAALERVRSETAAAVSRGMAMPSGARPGFLTAVAELLECAVRGVNQRTDRRALLAERVHYVFGQGAYELQLREVEPIRLDHDGQSVAAVRTAFEIRTLATDERTRFEVTSGTEGELAVVPVAISWQPRWWLRVALRLNARQ